MRPSTAELRRLLGTLPVARLSIDRSGIGMNLAENLSRDFPQVVGENFTNEAKERWATDFKILLQRRGQGQLRRRAQRARDVDNLGVLSYKAGTVSRTNLPYFEENTEPLASRIATGLHKIGLAMKQQAWQQANEEGLSATQGQILAALATHGALTGSELSQRLGVTLPTISDSVRVLVEKTLVTKSPDPRHPRASLLTPTKKGAQLGARARSWPEFMAAAVADLSTEEQRAFFSGVVKMIRSLQDQGLIPVSGMCVTCVHFRPNVRSGATPHHCALVDAPLATEQVRIDCAEHELAPEADRTELWERFMRAT